MRRVTLRSLWAHKRRLISTVIAVVLGVAFMSGTFVFADTLDKVFDELFTTGNEEVDAQVQGEALFSSSFGGELRERLDQSLVETVAAVDGVAAAEPYVITFGFGSTNRVIGKDGDAIGSANGPPTLIESWTEDELISPYNLTDGSRPPESADEIVLNVTAAEDGEYEIGDTVDVVSQFGRSQYELVGTVRFGDRDSSAGAVSAEFELTEAQRLAGAEDEVNTILVRADEGISDEEIVSQIAEAVPPEVEVLTGEQATAQLTDSVTEGFDFFRILLTVFALIALLVGMFIISNTFSILIAQRTRELALLRAVGATRTQVLTSVLLEAVLVGLVAAVLGLLAGIGLAFGVTALLKGLGVDFPEATLVVSQGTVLWAILVGLVVTVLASVIPAVKATRVPALAALRDVAIDRSGASRFRLWAGVVIIVLATYNLAQAWRSDGSTDNVPVVGLGALLAILGAIVIGPVLASPSVRLLGAVLPRFKGVTGKLATENAARSPKRTSATASALLIGVALVGFITCFASSAKASVKSEIERGVKADLIVQSDSGFGGPSGFPTTVKEQVARLDGVEVTSSVAFGEAEFTYPDGDTARTFLTSIDPDTINDVLTPRMVEGDIDDLTDGGVIVDDQIVDRNNLEIGDQIGVVVAGGQTATLRVQGISNDESILGFWTITNETYTRLVPERLDLQVYANLADGAELEAVRAEIEELIADIPSMEVLDRDQFIGDIAAQLTALVNVIYGLLGLSIVIAVMGIRNTLALSIHERTREFGLLRAVGMSRRQLRSSVRWEAVLISVLGTLVGLGVGLVLSLAMIRALEGFGLTTFRVPVGTLIVIVVLAALLGVYASWRPARRAAKLDILYAIATE